MAQKESVEEITERKLTEVELRKKDFIIHSASSAIATVKLDGKMAYANPAFLEKWGFENQDEVLGRHFTEFWMVGNRLDEIMTALNDNVRKWRGELSAQKKDGSFFDVLVSAATVLDDKGNPIEHMSTSIDITESKRTTKALAKAKSYISNIIDSMPSVIVGVGADGRITQWNTEAQRKSGVSEEDAEGRLLEDVFPRLAEEMERVRDSIRMREVYTCSRQECKVDGETRYEDVTVYPLISNDIEGAVIRIDDVTDNVRMEEMMIQNEKMLSVGGLATGMAHEINNPLSIMMQTTYVMAIRLGKGLDIPANVKAAEASGTTMEAIKKFIDARGIPDMISIVNESGYRIAGLVDNMLNFASKSDSSKSSHNMADLLDKVLILAATDYDLRQNYDFRMIEIKKVYDDNLPLVTCEAAEIQQVLLSIFKNGTRVMQEETGWNSEKKFQFIVRLVQETETKMLRIEIEDNGPGMDKTTLKRIFEPFYTTNPVGVGSGLGLFVAYFIITENHGGEMSVESTPGSGAKFIIRLPLEH